MELAVAIYELTKKLPASERFGLFAQMRRAAVSVASNIAEGHGRVHRAEYIHHVSIASGSLREVETQLELVVRTELIDAQSCSGPIELARRVGQVIAGLIRGLRRA